MVIFFSRFELFFQRGSNESLVPVAAVVRHDVEVGACGFQFVHQDHEVRVAEAHDDIHLRAHIVERLCLRIRDGNAQSSANDRDLLHAVEVACHAQRADKVQNAVALVQHIQTFRRVADLLVDDGDGAARGIRSGDGQRNAFSVFVHAQDDELPRFRFFRDIRRLHLHERDRFMQRTLCYDSVHWVSFPMLLQACVKHARDDSDFLSCLLYCGTSQKKSESVLFYRYKF